MKFIVIILIVMCFSFSTMAGEQQMGQQDVKKSSERSIDHPKEQSPDIRLNPDETSVDLPRLQQATSLKEIYKLAGGMHIGTANDQDALTKAVSDYMMKCCTDYDLAIQEIKKAGFKDIRDVTSNYLEHKDKYAADSLEFDKIIYSEYSRTVWLAPRSFQPGDFLFSLFPQFRLHRITLYFNNDKLLKVHSVMHTEGL